MRTCETSTLRQHAKKLRDTMTDAERALWYQLRNRRYLGIKFYRQKIIGNYIVDFVSLENGIVIEVDGSQHQEQQAYDEQRSRFLQSQGLRVLRFWNHEVLTQMEQVLESIRLTVEENSEHR